MKCVSCVNNSRTSANRGWRDSSTPLRGNGFIAVLISLLQTLTRLAILTPVILVIVVMTSNNSHAENILSFTSTDYITTPGKIITINFTLEAWVKPTVYQSEQQVLSQYAGGIGRMIMGVKEGKVGLFVNGTWIKSNGDVPLNEWTHIATIRDGSNWSFYINGEYDSTKAGNSTALQNTTVMIGRITTTSGAGYQGMICDARVWSTVRNATEIQDNYNKRLNGNETGLLYYWPLNEGSGTTVTDQAESANGTIGGASWTLEIGPPFVVPDVPVGAWNIATGGNWSEAGNWLESTVPSGNGATAYFTNQPPTAITVTNDESDLVMGQFILEGSSGHTFTGNTITLTNNVASSLIYTTGGDHIFDLPLVTTGLGLSLLPVSSSSLTMDDVISGPGSLSVNPISSDSGTVTLNAANTYTGSTKLGSGTCEIGTLANGGVASPLGASSSDSSNLVFGPGTLRYTGGTVTTDRGYTADAGSQHAMIIDTDSDITFGGQITANSGAFIKTGTGTVSFTYPGLNTYATYEGNANALLTIPENGDSPTVNGYSGMTIVDGKVSMGAAGQTNLFNNRIEIGIYSTTNASEETSGELEINDGVFICTTTLSIGRQNGNTNTAPDGTTSKLTINGGECYLALVASGFNGLGLEGFNSRSIYEINDGYVEQSRSANMGEYAGSKISMNVNGGHLKITEGGAGLRLGAGTGEGTLTITGDAIVEVADYVGMAIGEGDESKGTCNLNGGILIASDFEKGSGTSAILNFNGGVFKPHTSGRSLSGLTSINVSTNGAFIDSSLAYYTIVQDFLHDTSLGGSPDGGLTKMGSEILALNFTDPTYTGPTTVSNGTLQVNGNLPAASDVIVASAGNLTVGGNANKTLTVGGLNILGTGMITLGFTADGSANDKLAVNGTPTPGSGQIALVRTDNEMPFTENGTYTIMTYTGSDPVVSGLTCANPVFGKTYTFAASSGSATLTIATDTTGASVWNVDAGGAWATEGNWTVAPANAAGSQVRFDDVITGPVTVTSAGETVGEIYFNNANTYTIGGTTGLTLDNNALDSSIVVESGSHVISAPLDLANDTSVSMPSGTTFHLGELSGGSSTLSAQGEGSLYLTEAPSIQALSLDIPAWGLTSSMTITPDIELSRTVYVAPAQDTSSTIDGTISGSGGLTKALASTLEVTADNTYSGATTVHAGTLKISSLADGGEASPIGTSSAASANLVIREATLHITDSVTSDRGYKVSVVNQSYAAVLRTDDDVTFGGQIQADNGPFLKTGPGTVYYTYPGVNQLNADDVNRAYDVQDIGDNGEGPYYGVTGFTVTQGKVVLGVPGQTNNVAGHLDIGLCTTADPGAETTGELVLNDGKLTSGTLSVGRGNGTTTTAPGGISSRLTVNGGLIECGTLAMGNGGAAGKVPGSFNARPIIEVNGGLVSMSGTYLSVGESTGSYATLLVNGGKIDIYNDGKTLRMGPNGDGLVVLSNDGEIDVNGNVEMAYSTGSHSTIHLDGGTLTARNIIKGSGTQADLRFNGGTFIPSAAGQTMSGLTSAAISTNGAIIDTSFQSYTIAQTLVTDADLNGSVDGGLTKLGANTLNLTAVDNTFNGQITVSGGTLQAIPTATNDIFVAGGAVFDAAGERIEVNDLAGEGLLNNGTIAVHGVLDCGTGSTPAGSIMSVGNLTMAAGSTFVCEWETNSVGEVTNDFVTVTGNVASEGRGYIDFNRDESDPITVPFETTIMSYGTASGSFVGWRALNTGLPDYQTVSTIVKAENNVVTVKIDYGGTVMLIR